MLKLYNTATRKIENFKPLSEVVKMYTCGPTVYSFAHIGNYTAYIYWDLLVRTLLANGYAVRRVMNMTDVGHLTSDGDEGEDKLEKGAAREGKSVWEVAEFYAADFMKNFAALELVEPAVIARATDYIEADKQAVDQMTANGFTYETRDGVYYDTAKFPAYANFARLDLAGLKAGARVAYSDEKRNAADFAVWKFIQPGEKHEMRWDYLGRPGYPGWHLECSTIIHEELGEPIDIHTGGIDHIPVHHTNEIAQTYALNGLDLARVWVHCGFITIDGEKISKSLGNVYLFDDLAARGFSHLDYKMWVLSGHYQGTRNFTFESLEAARTRRLNWRNRIAELRQTMSETKWIKAPESLATGPAAAFPSPRGLTRGSLPAASPVAEHDAGAKVFTANVLSDVGATILDAVNNNLNSAEAFALIDNSELTMADWEFVDELFGLRLLADTPDISDEAKKLIVERQEARDAKDYARSDQIRDILAQQNIGVRDTADGAIWYYLK